MLWHADQSLIDCFNKLWYEEGKWPTAKLIKVKCGTQRFYSARRKWAEREGITPPDMYEVRKNNEYKPKPKRKRTEFQTISHILKRFNK